jgi:hypothetical protein
VDIDGDIVLLLPTYHAGRCHNPQWSEHQVYYRFINQNTERSRTQLCPSAQLIKHYALKIYGGVDVWSHIFFISALVGGEWSASRHSRFTSGEKKSHPTHWIGSWVVPRGALDVMEKKNLLSPPEIKSRFLNHPARNSPQYRLSCPCTIT